MRRENVISLAMVRERRFAAELGPRLYEKRVLAMIEAELAVEGCGSGMESPEIGSHRNADAESVEPVTLQNQPPKDREDG